MRSHLLLIPLVILPALARAQTAPSSPDAPTYKRPLTLKIPQTDAPGENVAVVECYLNGAQKPDGSDIRVTETVRGVVPVRVLQISPSDDFVRVAFEARGEGGYTLWWGNTAGIKPAGPLAVTRGVLTEVYKFPGGPVRDEAQLKRAFEKAGPPQGATFVPEVFLAYNPLGEEWNAMLRYTGQFKVDKGGPFDIGFTVADAGYLKIDDKLVDQHYNEGLRGHVRSPRQVDLKAGWHTIEVAQVNAGGGQAGVAVVWRHTGDKAYAPMPPGVFAPIARAAEGPTETVGKVYTADCAVTPEAEVFSPPDAYLQRYAFEARFPDGWKPTVAWDFGDGQTAALAKAHHYYLTPGTYAVTLKVQQAGTTYTSTRRVTVRDRMYARFPRPPEDVVKTVAAVLTTYDPKKTSAEGAFRAAMLFKKYNENDLYTAWGRAWLESKETTSPQTYRDELFDYSRLMLLRKDYKGAADAYTLAAGHAALPVEQRLGYVRSAVMLTCDYLDDVAGAAALADEWQKKVAPGNKQQAHAALAAVTYAAIAKGDGKSARKAAADAGTRREQPYDRQQLQQGVLARDVETYVRTKDFDTATRLIDEWEWEYPEAMVDGFTRLLRVKLLTAEQRPAVAARVALAHAKALPESFYAAELLYRASTNFTAAGDADRAKAAMELLRSKYPESPYAQNKGKVD